MTRHSSTMAADLTQAERIATLVAPLVFLAHDLEEALQTERMNDLAELASRRLPEPLAARVGRLRHTRDGMIAFALAAFGVQSVLALWSRKSPKGRRVLTTLTVARAVNGVTHMAETLVLRRYVPGTATAPALIVLAIWLAKTGPGTGAD